MSVTPLAILCGGGDLPIQAALSAQRNGSSPFLVGIAGAADKRIEAWPHAWVRLGEIGKLLRLLSERGTKHLAIIGGLDRPELSDLRLDWGAIKRLPDLVGLFRGGDNHLLTGVVRFLEAEGLIIVGVDTIAPDLVAAAGALTLQRPDPAQIAEAEFGAALIAALSGFDVGQAAVMVGRRVIAIEAAEGTEAMLARVAQMRASGRLRLKGRAGLLIKAPKRGQDLRLDMPVVGVKTVQQAKAAMLAGIALAAGQVLVADREAFIAEANAAGLIAFGHTL